MATRSMIGKLNANGTVTAIYCHWDGYPEYVGTMLKESWSDESNVDQLMALGNLSILGREIGVKHPFDRIATSDWGEKYEHMCLAYGRDRGEKNQECQIFNNAESFAEGGKFSGTEYFYLWMEGIWCCWSYKGVEIDLYKPTPEEA
jgi:hypothetical protein